MSKTTDDINAIKLQIKFIEDNIKSLREAFDSYLEKVSEAHSKSDAMEDFVIEPYMKEVIVIETCELYDKVEDIRNIINCNFDDIFETIKYSNEDVRSAIAIANNGYDDPN